MKKHLSKILTLILIICSAALVFVVTPNTKNEQNSMPLQAATASDSYFNLSEEYYLKSVSQESYGTCWTFAACGVVESFLAVNYGLYIDISEAWIGVLTKAKEAEIDAIYSGDNSYSIGKGGDPKTALYLMETYGFLLEQEFPYTNYDGLNDATVNEIYNLYKDISGNRKLSNFGMTYNGSYPNFYGTYSGSTLNINSIKNYLVTNGAMATSIYYDDTKMSYDKTSDSYIYSTPDSSGTNHAVRVIGWNDNISINGKKGGFLFQNSHGNASPYSFEQFYISYSDFQNSSKKIRCYKFTDLINSYEIPTTGNSSPSDSLEVISNSKTFRKENPSGTSYFGNNKNVFYYNEDIDISFKLKAFTEETPVITYNNKDVSSYFTSTYDTSSNTFNITASKETLATGTYVVNFKVKNFIGNIINYFATIHIISGLEINTISSGTPGYLGTVIISPNNANTYNTINSKSGSSLNMYPSKCNLITDIEVVNDSTKVTVTLTNCTFATTSSYTSGSIKVTPKLVGTTAYASFSLIVKSSIVKTEKTYTFNVISSSEKGGRIFTYYDLNGEIDYDQQLMQYSYLSNNKVYLPNIRSFDKQVDKWQYKNSSGNFVDLSYDNSLKQYYFTNTQYSSIEGSINTTGKRTVSYIVLRPTWTKLILDYYRISYQSISKGLTIDDGNHNRKIDKDPAADKSYTFTIVVKKGFEATNISITGVTANKTGNPNEYKIDNISADVTITITADIKVIAPSAITLSPTADISKTYDGKATTITATMEYNLDTTFTAHFIWYKKDSQSKTLVDVFDLNKTISTIEVKNVADSGEYTCEVYITLDGADSAHVTTTTPININITKAKIEIDLIDFTMQYGDEFDINKTSDKYKKVSGEIFNNDDLNLTFKTSYNKTSTAGQEYDVEFDKSTNNNYEVVVKNTKAKITVLKRKLKIKAKSFSTTKNDELYIVTNNDYELVDGNLVNGDTLPLIISCDVKKDSGSGSYDIKIKLDESASNYNKIKDNYDIEFIDGNYSIRASYLEFLITGMRYWCFVQIALTLIVCIAKIVNKKRYN